MSAFSEGQGETHRLESVGFYITRNKEIFGDLSHIASKAICFIVSPLVSQEMLEVRDPRFWVLFSQRSLTHSSPQGPNQSLYPVMVLSLGVSNKVTIVSHSTGCRPDGLCSLHQWECTRTDLNGKVLTHNW